MFFSYTQHSRITKTVFAHSIVQKKSAEKGRFGGNLNLPTEFLECNLEGRPNRVSHLP
jgi:hypothetical protein